MNYWLNVLHQKLMQIFLQHLINIYSFSLLSVYKHNLANLVLILCEDESQTLLTWCSIVQDPRPCSGNILPGGFYDSSPICGQLLSFNPLSLVECLWSSCGNGIDYLFSRTYETKSHESVTVCTDMMQMMRRREK